MITWNDIDDEYMNCYDEDFDWSELDEDSHICPACNGSGEGQADGTVCGECGGCGES